MTLRADDNWFQRRYFVWAETHYRRMPPNLRAEVERIDRWLYSRRAAGIWFTLGTAVVASVLGLSAWGMPWLLALVVSMVVWGGLPTAVMGAWLQPERFAGRKGIRLALVTAALAFSGAAVGFLIGRIVKHGGLETATLWPAVRGALGDVAPYLALAALVLGATLELAAFARRRLLRADLERAQLVIERDAAARQAAEARLRLLQGQIRPHFIFNTLASLQHWVDTGDARAGPLLRSLTSLLRSSTEAMTAPCASLGAECEAAGHYLAVMQARLGSRLAYRVGVEPSCAAVEVPAGLVLTLVENAVEHGIEPMLAGGTVVVAVTREAGAVVLRVDDDGAGLGEGAAAGEAQSRGVGLVNSRERLRHRYDARAALELLPGPGATGTRAQVRIEDAP